jgi:Zn-dependent protease with chaperone function
VGHPDDHQARHRWLLRTVRYILPTGIVVIGLVFMAMGGETNLEGGAAVVSAGLAVYFLNWLFRAGASGDREREAEDAARDYFDQHGRWPE